MLPGVNAGVISVEAMAPYLAFVTFFTSIPFSVRHAVVRRHQNLCTQFIYILHARVRSWELVQHFVVRLPAEVACSCCYSHIVCCVTCDTAAFRRLTCQCDIKARSFDF